MELYNTNKFIRNAATDKKPTFAFYKQLCQLEGTQKIDYVDFDWRYYQFYHGNRDLAIQKSPENSSPLTFSDLPILFLEKLMKELGLVDCLVIRKVCRDFRSLVDSMEFSCERISLNLGESSFRIDFPNLKLSYEEVYGERCALRSERPEMKRTKEHLVYGNAQQMMISDVSTFLKNPKLKIAYLNFFGSNIQAQEEFLKLLKSLTFQLDVQTLRITRPNEKLIFQFLKPGNLKNIRLIGGGWTVEEHDEIAETEQWKRARRMYLFQLPNSGEYRMENLIHFKEIRIDRFKFNVKNLTMIRDILLKSSHLESCILKTLFRYDDEETTQRIMSQDPAYNSQTRRFSIQNSRDYFQFEFVKFRGFLMKLVIKKVFES